MATIPSKQLREHKYLTLVFGTRETDEPDAPVFRDIEPKDFVADLYHPGKVNPGAYRPGNELASEYTALQVLWMNFVMLLEKAKRDSDGYSRKLTLKAAAVELRSFFDSVPRLATLVAKVPAHDGSQPRAFICLTQQERDGFEKSAKALGACKNKLFTTLTKVRNGVGAHMSRPLLKGSASVKPKEELSWQAIEELWQLLEPRMFLDVAQAGTAFLASAQHLPLYEFFRYESSTRMRIHVPAVAEERGPELRFTALSPSLVAQIEQLDPSVVEGTTIVFRREPVLLRVQWPQEFLDRHPELGDGILEV